MERRPAPAPVRFVDSRSTASAPRGFWRLLGPLRSAYRRWKDEMVGLSTMATTEKILVEEVFR